MKYCSVSFHYEFKIDYCVLRYTKLKIKKQVVFKLRAVEYAISFFPISYVCFHKAFVKNFMKKLSFFSTNFQNSSQNKRTVYYRTEYYNLKPSGTKMTALLT